MKGLLLKDFLTVRRKYGAARLIMDLAIVAALMIVLEGAGAVCVSLLLAPLEVASMTITLANCDEQWKWGRYAVALPVSKRQIVASRYAFGGIAAAAGFGAALLVNAVACWIFPDWSIGLCLLLAAASLVMSLLFLSLILPSNYWRGVNVGFAVMFVLIIAAVGLGLWLRATGVALLDIAAGHLELCAILIIAAVLALFGGSLALSTSLFRRRYA